MEFFLLCGRYRVRGLSTEGPPFRLHPTNLAFIQFSLVCSILMEGNTL